MAFFNRETGCITFPDGLVVQAGMDASALEALYRNQRELVLAPRSVPGGQVGALVGVEDGRISYVLLSVSAVTGRVHAGGARQREFLLELLGLRDPCPQSLSCARFTAPFGSVWMLTQPYTGAFSALIQYKPLQEEH